MLPLSWHDVLQRVHSFTRSGGKVFDLPRAIVSHSVRSCEPPSLDEGTLCDLLVENSFL